MNWIPKTPFALGALAESERWEAAKRAKQQPEMPPGFEYSEIKIEPGPIMPPDPTLFAREHPAHYTASPSGVECIEITEHMSFLRGNAVEYLWRAGSKGDELEDLRKARWYLDREISNLERANDQESA